MGGINDEVIQQVKLHADIVDVVQSYLPTLKRMGATWKACCPFHKEKTPSFTVNPNRSSFKCFGCGKGGDVISFVMEIEQLSFLDAVELLARRFGIYIPEPTFVRGNSGKISAKKEDGINYGSRDRLSLLHEKLADFYRKNLLNHPDSPVAQYFLTRGIPNDIAEQFKIGAAPDTWDSALQFARQQGFLDDELRESGIVSSKEEDTNHIYDRFRNRLVFPIWNEQGRIVGFSARSIEKDPQGWKYVNTPETPIFHKGKLLYALNFARVHIAKADCVIICEGQLDTIAWHRAGIPYAVAPQGTAFTPDQAIILKRHTHNVILALDHDSAGEAAVMKDAAILLPLGFSIKVASYQGAKDADETLAKYGPDALQKTIDNAVDFFEFAVQNVSKNLDMSIPADRSKAVIAIVDWIIKLEDPVTIDQYANWLSARLSTSLNIIEMEIRYRREQNVPRQQYQLSAQETETQNTPKITASAKFIHDAALLLQIISYDKNYAERAANHELLFQALDIDEPLPKAIESILQSAMLNEWTGKCNEIITEFQKKGYSPEQLTSLYTSPLVPESHSEYAKYASGEISFEELSPELQEPLLIFEEMTYNSCVNSIIFDFLQRKKDTLAKAVSDPSLSTEQRLHVLEEFQNASLELNKLMKKI